uniref:Guamerin n=1 Tax=Hirudinaria manillensis TaxID=1348078 RepID=A0A290YV98_HIRMN|nr:guamerin [Hirudinaria manillensis]
MKVIVFCCLLLAGLFVANAADCGGKTCSGGQVCSNDVCVCTKIRCRILCRNGFLKDENGCEYPCTCA